MRNRTVATRYARALLNTAASAGTVDGVAESFASVMDVMDRKPELLGVLAAPHISEEKKRDLLESVFAGRIEKTLLHFFRLLVEKQRMDSLREMHVEFQNMVEIKKGYTRAVVITAIPLPDDLETDLVAKLSTMTGRKIVLRKEVDPAVMGGACIRMGDEIIDGTIRTNLSRLRTQLLQADVR